MDRENFLAWGWKDAIRYEFLRKVCQINGIAEGFDYSCISDPSNTIFSPRVCVLAFQERQ